MDGLSDSEVSDIWDRVSKYVDLKELKGTDTESIQKTLKEALENASAPAGKRGSIDTLIKNKFARRAVKVQKIYETLEPIARDNRIEEIREKTSKSAIKEIDHRQR